MIIIQPNPQVIGAQLGADIQRLLTDEFGLVLCPNCLGGGVIPRPWPSPDPDPVACPTCDQAGRVSSQVRDEWLDWQQGGEPA